jgi:hypothetical protein
MNPLGAMLNNNNNNEHYSMTSQQYKNILLKNQLELHLHGPFTQFGFGVSNGQVDIETEYSFNSFGYRDIDWNSKAEILAVGCSNTLGVGVPVEGRWTNILEKKVNKKIQNLGIAGSSINELISKSFQYFKKFGNPETLLFLFPDPFRVPLPFKKNLIIGNYDKNDLNEDDLFIDNVCFPYSEEYFKKSKYFKIPYSYRQVLPLELPIFFSMQSIHMLEQYCKSNNIKLIWSSWFDGFARVLDDTQENIFSNFFSLLSSNANTHNFKQNCHKNYKNEFEKYFDNGADIEYGLDFSHPGVHWHIHIAEAFYKEINK